MKYIIFILMIVNISYAGLIIKPEEVLKENFPDAEIIKKNIMLTKSQRKKVETTTKYKTKSYIYTTYIIKQNNKVIGYALLHFHKVRTKNEVVLITFDKNCNVKDVEVIAFYEPPEYIPDKNWRNKFVGMNLENQPFLKKNIPNITGATLSAKVLTDGVRNAIGICEVGLKGRFK